MNNSCAIDNFTVYNDSQMVNNGPSETDMKNIEYFLHYKQVWFWVKLTSYQYYFPTFITLQVFHMYCLLTTSLSKCFKLPHHSLSVSCILSPHFILALLQEFIQLWVILLLIIKVLCQFTYSQNITLKLIVEKKINHSAICKKRTTIGRWQG